VIHEKYIAGPHYRSPAVLLAATQAIATIRITAAAVVCYVTAVAYLHLIFHNANLLCYCNIAINTDKKNS